MGPAAATVHTCAAAGVPLLKETLAVESPLASLTIYERAAFPFGVQVTTPLSSLPPASPMSKGGASATDGNRPYMHEVQSARFFYMDQFVLLATGSKLHLYRYKV